MSKCSEAVDQAVLRWTFLTRDDCRRLQSRCADGGAPRAACTVAVPLCVAAAVANRLLVGVIGGVGKAICRLLGAYRCAVARPMRLARGRIARGMKPRVADKVFVLMLENRSFDEMLGYSPLTGPDASTGQTVAVDNVLNHPGLGNEFPPGSGTIVPPTPTAPFKLPDRRWDPGHEFDDTIEQLWGPGAVHDPAHPPAPGSATCGGFIASYAKRLGLAGLEAHAPEIMAGFPPERLPVLNALAREFAVCDRWFASIPGPTWPNRFFLHAATSGGLDHSPDPLDVAEAALSGFRFTNGTIFDRLDASCIGWRVYAGDEFPQVLALSGMPVNALAGRIARFSRFAADVARPDFAPSYVFIEPDYGNILPGTTEDFTCGTSQHPVDDVTRGERLIKAVYEAIRASPHWEKSLLVITYDEHGGFYDHVAPPAGVPPGDGIQRGLNHFGFDFSLLGPRVPAVVISPRIPRGTIDRTVYDHASVPATIERLFGLKPLTRRDAAANDLLHLLSLDKPRSDAPSTLPEPADSGYRCPGDPAFPEAVPATPPAAFAAPAAPATPPATATGTTPLREGETVPTSFWGFMHVALRRALMLVPPDQREERSAMVDAFQQVGTAEEARQFIHMARSRVREQEGGGEP